MSEQKLIAKLGVDKEKARRSADQALRRLGSVDKPTELKDLRQANKLLERYAFVFEESKDDVTFKKIKELLPFAEEIVVKNLDLKVYEIMKKLKENNIEDHGSYDMEEILCHTSLPLTNIASVTLAKFQVGDSKLSTRSLRDIYETSQKLGLSVLSAEMAAYFILQQNEKVVGERIIFAAEQAKEIPQGDLGYFSFNGRTYRSKTQLGYFSTLAEMGFHEDDEIVFLLSKI